MGWLYTFWYQVAPFATSDNADAQVWGLMMVLTLGLMFVPLIPGLRDIRAGSRCTGSSGVSTTGTTLDASRRRPGTTRSKYLRTFTAAVIAELPLTGNTASPEVTALLDFVQVLRELNRTARRIVPARATTAVATSFVPTRWRGYVDTTHGQGRGAAYRYYGERRVRYGLQARLPSADVWVPGSRCSTDPTTLLIPVEAWAMQRDDSAPHRHRPRSSPGDPATGRRAARCRHRPGAGVGRSSPRGSATTVACGCTAWVLDRHGETATRTLQEVWRAGAHGLPVPLRGQRGTASASTTPAVKRTRRSARAAVERADRQEPHR